MRILVAPLDWGLGHATRCIPIIRYLLEKKCEVVIAADKRPLELLKKEFPQLEFVVLPGYGITYPEKRSMALQMLLSVPGILKGIRREHRMLKEIIAERKIQAVLSDNRYGLYSNEVPSIFITHQLNIQSPFGSALLNRINRRFISRYTECWVPDAAGEDNLSGDLSHGRELPSNVCFIGSLTRFSLRVVGSEIKNDVMVLLSGPEPQRSILERNIIGQLSKTPLRTIIARGVTEETGEQQVSSNIKMIAHVSGAELQQHIAKSAVVVSRPGYSTIMDLSVMGAKAIFVPTPGQTEQEYLGNYFMKKGIAYSVAQNDFNLQDALRKAEAYWGFTSPVINDDYKKKVDDFLSKLTP